MRSSFIGHRSRVVVVVVVVRRETMDHRTTSERAVDAFVSSPRARPLRSSSS